MNLSGKILVFYFLTIHHCTIVCPTVTCDFEIDACNWNMDSTWKVYPSGSTPDTASSGPVSDHTSGTGNYARFMGNLLAETDQFGLMTTNTSLDVSTSFSFWYYMQGTQIGTLSLVVNNQILWQKSKRQGLPAWYQANLMLPLGSDIQIIFSANRTGLGRSSDIALDDILLEGEPLPSTRTTPTRASTTPRVRYNASCDFDVDQETCGWKSDTKYGWKILAQRETNVKIGPASDYSSITRGNTDGKFCAIPYDDNGPQYYCLPYQKVVRCKGSDTKYINCRDGFFAQIRTGTFDDVGERSQFESPVLDALSTEGCLQFQYNIAGTDNDWLNVYVEDYWTERQSCMWHKNGSSVPNRWVAAEAPLRVQAGDKYKIGFEARKGQAGGEGLVSLDHIVVSSKPCSGSFVVEECPPEEITTTTTVPIPTTTTTIEITTTSTTSPATTTTTSIVDETTTISTTIETMSTATSPTTTITTSTTTTTTTVTTLTSTTTTSTTTATTTTLTSSTTTTTTEGVTLTSDISTMSQSETPISTSQIPMITTSTTIAQHSTTTRSSSSTTDIDISGQTTKKPSLSASATAGIVVGVLVGLVIVAVVFFIYRRSHSREVLLLNHSPTYDRLTSRYSSDTSNDGLVRFDGLGSAESSA